MQFLPEFCTNGAQNDVCRYFVRQKNMELGSKIEHVFKSDKFQVQN